MKNIGQYANQLLSSSNLSQHMIWLWIKMTGQYSRGKIGGDRRVAAKVADQAYTITVD